MAVGTITARVHLLQIELSGSTVKLHGHCVREMEDTDGTKSNVGNCAIEIPINRAAAKPLIDMIKAELVDRAAEEDAKPEAKQFKGLTLA